MDPYVTTQEPERLACTPGQPSGKAPVSSFTYMSLSKNGIRVWRSVVALALPGSPSLVR